MDFTAQDVGLIVNSSRSTVTVSERIRSGTPPTICGSGSDTTVRCASRWSTWMAARSTTVPRSIGPTLAGTTNTSENGAPLYGPARYAEPVTSTGAEPGPAPTLTEPTRESAAQVPACALASAQSGTPATWAVKPGGRSTDRVERVC